MKNINKILSEGTPLQKCLIYFESLCMDSIKEGTGKEGFLSNAEKLHLRYSFEEEKDVKLFNKFVKTYTNLTTSFDKVYILYLEFESSLNQYLWLTLFCQNQNSMLNAINDLHFEWNSDLQLKEVYRYNNFQESLIFGTLQQEEDGFFDIKQQNEINLFDQIPVIKQAVIHKLIKVKSAVNAIETYMDEKGFEIDTYKEITQYLVENNITGAKDLKLNYSELKINEEYSDWFRNYFLA